mmetsp:Transcript_17215/g.34522  ORF Transcript_17215/g.34522 Transcript_17215/m.34522 type:complete len:102 (-) Transcript_17215:815-1120(-)
MASHQAAGSRKDEEPANGMAAVMASLGGVPTEPAEGAAEGAQSVAAKGAVQDGSYSSAGKGEARTGQEGHDQVCQEGVHIREEEGHNWDGNEGCCSKALRD